jgi:hypothetical protein
LKSIAANTLRFFKKADINPVQSFLTSCTAVSSHTADVIAVQIGATDMRRLKRVGGNVVKSVNPVRITGFATAALLLFA